MLTRDMVEPILHEIKKLDGVDATAVVSRDGILVGAEIPPEVHGETFAIMSATMLGAAITANSELNKNMPTKVIVESDDGVPSSPARASTRFWWSQAGAPTGPSSSRSPTRP